MQVIVIKLVMQACSMSPLFVLDEIDLMSEKDKQKEILYLITHCPENYMATFCRS